MFFLENDVINDQLSRDTQDKIEKDIAANFPLVSDLIPIDMLHNEYAPEDLVYQQKVDVICIIIFIIVIT